MEESLKMLWHQMGQTLGGNVVNIIGALAILLFGYLAALIVCAVFKSICKRCKLNDYLKSYLPGMDIEAALGTGVFYLCMVFVLIAFFQALNLPQVTTPLNKLLDTIFAYLPKLLGAAILMLVAWCVAKIASTVIQKFLEATKVDSMLAPKSDDKAPADAKKSISATIANSVFGIVILLFLPSILESLGMTAALEPFNKLIAQVLGFLPNLLSAAVVLYVGIFVSGLVRQIVAGMLSAAGLDALADRVGVGAALGKGKLSGLLGSVAYLFLLLPFVVASLDALKMEAVSHPASMMLAKILNAIPNIFGAALVLGISYVVATLVSGLVVNVLQGAGFDGILVSLGLQKSTESESKKPSNIVGGLLIAAIMMYAAVEAASLLGFMTVATQIGALIIYCGKILMALVVMGVGMFIANFTADLIRDNGSAGAQQIAAGVRIGLIVLFAGMALNQTGIGDSIVNIGYASILGGVGLAIALGVGLSFGLGARDTAGTIAKDWHSSMTNTDDASKPM